MLKIRFVYVIHRVFIIQVLLVTLFLSMNLNAGIHLNWSWSGSSDILMCQVQVPYTTVNTYYEVLGWGGAGSDGDGYAGIQSASQGNNFIYALWDPTNGQAIKSVYSYPKSTVENFGGEGTGMHILNYSIGWKANDWINIATRLWQYKGHTYFGYWTFNYTRNSWYHLITMDYPIAKINFSSSNGAFIEDWMGDLNNKRAMNVKEGWSRTASTKKWNAWTNGSFDHNNPDPYKSTYDWGVNGDHFFMNNGVGYTPSSTQTKFTLAASGASPSITIGQVTNVALNYTGLNKQLKVSWIVDSTKSPQFIYLIEVSLTADFSGANVLSKQDTTPHLRDTVLNTTGLADRKYYVRVSFTDIFDQKSNSIVKDFTIGTSGIKNIIGLNNTNQLSIFPNPCVIDKYVLLLSNVYDNSNLSVSIYNNAGRKIIQNDLILNGHNNKIDVGKLSKGVYCVVLKNKKSIQNIKFIKK